MLFYVGRCVQEEGRSSSVVGGVVFTSRPCYFGNPACHNEKVIALME
jgi:hypothetical protein